MTTYGAYTADIAVRSKKIKNGDVMMHAGRAYLWDSNHWELSQPEEENMRPVDQLNEVLGLDLLKQAPGMRAVVQIEMREDGSVVAAELLHALGAPKPVFPFLAYVEHDRGTKDDVSHGTESHMATWADLFPDTIITPLEEL